MTGFKDINYIFRRNYAIIVIHIIYLLNNSEWINIEQDFTVYEQYFTSINVHHLITLI